MEPTTSTTRRPRRQGCEPYCKAHVHCPACNSRRHRTIDNLPHGSRAACRFRQCTHCQALFGTCLRGEAYAVVALHQPMEEAPGATLRYFDLTLLGSTGVERVHGWYNPATKRVAQIG